MIGGKAAHGDITDRPLAAEGSIEAIETEIFPSPEIETMPRLGPRLFRCGLDLYKCRLIRIFSGESRQPIAIAFLCQPPAEGFSEFFTAPSTNSTLTSPNLRAHQSTALRMSR